MTAAAGVGLLVGWLAGGLVYAVGPLPDGVCVALAVVAGVAAGVALHRRMASPYADWFEDHLVGTRTGRWLLTVAVLLAVLVLVRLLTDAGGSLGETVWGLRRL